MKRFSPSFFIGSISIGTVEGASCVNMGNNLPSGFVNYKKQNQGFGSITGDNNDIREILGTIDENAISDTFHYDVADETKNDSIFDQIQTEMLKSELNFEENDKEIESNQSE